MVLNRDNKEKAMVFNSIRLAVFMKENGITIIDMDMVMKSLQVEIRIRETTFKAVPRAKVFTRGRVEKYMMENGKVEPK